MRLLSKNTAVSLIAIQSACFGTAVNAQVADAPAGANGIELSDSAANEVTFREVRMAPRLAAPVGGATETVSVLQASKTPAAQAVEAVDWINVSESLVQSGVSGAAAEVVFNEVSTTVGAGLTDSPTVAEEVASETVASETIAPREKAGRHVIISNVEFDGNTVIDSATLGQVAAPFIGRRIGLSDLEELRIQLTRAYVDRGYLNSGAILPDQKVEEGNIVYKVVEGTLVDVTVDGEGDLREKYILERVLKDAAEPFNSFALQENFQLLLDDPLIERMDGQLQALPQAGRTALNLRVTRARPYDFSITGSNHGALSLGAQQVFLNGVLRNVSGRGDELGITVGGNQNKYNLSTIYEIPISSEETRVTAMVSIADSSVIEEPFDSINIESETLGADIAISRSLKRTTNSVLTVGTGFALRENKNTLAGDPFSFSSGEEDGRSRVAVMRVWQDLVQRGEKDVLAARATLNMGLDMFGSTAHDDSRPDSQFFSLQGQLQYARRYFEDRAQLLLKLDAQIATTQLLPLERFALGGAGSVRGYRENELVRDQALLASAELRYPFFRSADYGVFQVAPFLDVGYGENKAFFKSDEKLASVGLGFLWSLRSQYFAELYFGSVLRDLDSRDGDSLQERGVHFKLVAEF